MPFSTFFQKEEEMYAKHCAKQRIYDLFSDKILGAPDGSNSAIPGSPKLIAHTLEKTLEWLKSNNLTSTTIAQAGQEDYIKKFSDFLNFLDVPKDIKERVESIFEIFITPELYLPPEEKDYQDFRDIACGAINNAIIDLRKDTRKQRYTIPKNTEKLITYNIDDVLSALKRTTGIKRRPTLGEGLYSIVKEEAISCLEASSKSGIGHQGMRVDPSHLTNIDVNDWDQAITETVIKRSVAKALSSKPSLAFDVTFKQVMNNLSQGQQKEAMGR